MVLYFKGPPAFAKYLGGLHWVPLKILNCLFLCFKRKKIPMLNPILNRILRSWFHRIVKLYSICTICTFLLYLYRSSGSFHLILSPFRRFHIHIFVRASTGIVLILSELTRVIAYLLCFVWESQPCSIFLLIMEHHVHQIITKNLASILYERCVRIFHLTSSLKARVLLYKLLPAFIVVRFNYTPNSVHRYCFIFRLLTCLHWKRLVHTLQTIQVRTRVQWSIA